MPNAYIKQDLMMVHILLFVVAFEIWCADGQPIEWKKNRVQLTDPEAIAQASRLIILFVDDVYVGEDTQHCMNFVKDFIHFYVLYWGTPCPKGKKRELAETKGKSWFPGK